MVLGLDTPLLTNIPLVLVSRRLLFFFLRRRAVCWFVLAVAPRWKSVCNNVREVLKTICWPRETEREREQSRSIRSLFLRGLGNEGPFRKCTWRLLQLEKRCHTLLLVFHVSLCNQGYLLWFKIEFSTSDYLRAHFPHLHKFCTPLFFESRKARNAGNQS